MTRDRILGRMVLIVALSGSASVLQAPHAAAVPVVARSIKVSAAPATVVVGSPVSVSGRLSSSPTGSTVIVQRYTSGAWRNYLTTRTRTRTGDFSVKITTNVPGQVKWRGVAPRVTGRTKVLSAAISNSIVVTTTGFTRRLFAADPDRNPLPSALSGDGKWLVNGENRGTLVIRELSTGSRTVVAQIAGYLDGERVSNDGSLVAYTSDDEGDIDRHIDAHVWDRASRQTTDYSDALVVGLSGDGRWLLLRNVNEEDVNVGEVNLIDRTTGNTIKSFPDPANEPGLDERDVYSISSTGRYVVLNEGWYTATGIRYDLVRWDRENNSRAVVASQNGWTNSFGSQQGRYVAADISTDGRWVAHLELQQTPDSDITRCRVTDMTTKAVSTVASGIRCDGYRVGDYPPFAMSDDGKYLAYTGYGSDTDQFEGIRLWSRATGASIRISNSKTGGSPNAHSSFPAISAGGRYVAYSSRASNLVASDPNGHAEDLFVWDRNRYR